MKNLTAAALELFEALEEFRAAHHSWLAAIRTDDDGAEGSDEAMYRLVEADKRANAALAKARGETS